MQKPDPAFIASQLRQPHGEFATEIAGFMTKSNVHIYKLLYSYLNLENGQEVLEVGPADGSFLNELFELNEMIHYTGVDFSEEMVKAATKNHARFIDSKKAKLIFSDIDAFHSDQKFDRIFSVNTIYFWKDPSCTMKHLRALLEPKGKLLLAFRDEATMKNLPFTEFGFNLFSVRKVNELLEEAGFQTIEFYSGEETIRLHDGSMVPLTNHCAIASN